MSGSGIRPTRTGPPSTAAAAPAPRAESTPSHRYGRRPRPGDRCRWSGRPGAVRGSDRSIPCRPCSGPRCRRRAPNPRAWPADARRNGRRPPARGSRAVLRRPGASRPGRCFGGPGPADQDAVRREHRRRIGGRVEEIARPDRRGGVDTLSPRFHPLHPLSPPCSFLSVRCARAGWRAARATALGLGQTERRGQHGGTGHLRSGAAAPARPADRPVEVDLGWQWNPSATATTTAPRGPGRPACWTCSAWPRWPWTPTGASSSGPHRPRSCSATPRTTSSARTRRSCSSAPSTCRPW